VRHKNKAVGKQFQGYICFVRIVPIKMTEKNSN